MAEVIALTIAYDGTPFSGFARQPNADTIQERLADALATALGREVIPIGAGRTDAGVHALGQVVTFDAVGDEPDDVSLMRSLNALLRPYIAVREVRHAHEGFSARFDAVRREYRYRVVSGRVPPVFLRDKAGWRKNELDLAAMVEASKTLVGEHDFRSFCVAVSAEGRSTVREIESIDFIEEEILGEKCLTVRIVGNAFLHSMVRVILGTLVEIGVGKKPPSWTAEVLAARDRGLAGQTAPPQGLIFWCVEYPKDSWSSA